MEFESVIIFAPLWIPLLIGIIFAIRYFVPYLLIQFHDQVTSNFLHYFIVSMPLWVPILLVVVAWKTWMLYIRTLFFYKLEWVLLEVRIPQEVLKTPLAMETFFMSLHQTGGETTFIDRHWKGSVRPYFSFEIVSIEGQVKFFIYTQKRFRSFIESGLYSFYPDIEIYEAPDYSRSVYFDPKDVGMYVIDYKKGNPDPYPIKTYVDYGLDKEGVEDENKVDPLNSVLEFMGSIGKNQGLWLQIIIRAHKGDQKKHGTLFGKTDVWKDTAKSEVEKIRASAVQKTEDTIKFPNPTKGEQERIAALERSVSKIGFDTGIRSIYWGKKDSFNGANITSQRTLLRAFNAQHLNTLSPTNWCNGFDYPWEDFRGIRKNHACKHGLEAYKRRCFFYQPYIGHSFVMNVEELATMYHFPGKVATTPNINRIPSKKSEAPSNLPI